MLVAEKQLLDANLRNDLQVLRRMELKMLVNRYQNAIPAATLIGGFTFTGVVEIDLLDPSTNPAKAHNQTVCIGLFHLFASLALAGSIYAMAVSSIAIILGQRLAIQATAQLTSKHAANVKELSSKFVTVLVALLISLIGVVGGALSAFWVKAEENVTIAATIFLCLMIPFIGYILCVMNYRLNDMKDEPSSISLKAGEQTLDVSEFRVGDATSIPSKGDIEHAMKGNTPLKAPLMPNESSRLLNCIAPIGCAQ